MGQLLTHHMVRSFWKYPLPFRVPRLRLKNPLSSGTFCRTTTYSGDKITCPPRDNMLSECTPTSCVTSNRYRSLCAPHSSPRPAPPRRARPRIPRARLAGRRSPRRPARGLGRAGRASHRPAGARPAYAHAQPAAGQAGRRARAGAGRLAKAGRRGRPAGWPGGCAHPRRCPIPSTPPGLHTKNSPGHLPRLPWPPRPPYLLLPPWPGPAGLLALLAIGRRPGGVVAAEGRSWPYGAARGLAGAPGLVVLRSGPWTASLTTQ